MARWKRDEILKERISEAAGIPVGDICAQDSRELHEIASALGVQIEDDFGESNPKAGQLEEGGSQQQQHTYAAMLKQGGSSILQAGVRCVQSLVIGLGEEAGVGVGDQKSDDISVPTEEESVELHRAKANVKQLQSALKYSRNASDGGDKARKALKKAEDKVEALMTPRKDCQLASGATLEEEASPPSSISSQADLIVKTATTSSICSGSSIAQHIKSSIPCTSLTRRSKEETFAEATSLPLVKLRSVERRRAGCTEANVGQLMQKVKKLKGYGLGIMGGHVENVQWVHLTGPSVRETVLAPLWRSRSLPQWQTLYFGKGGDCERSSTKSADATKKIANLVKSVNTSGSSCIAREANSSDHTRNAFGPSPADFIGHNVPPSSNEPIGAESGPIPEKQTGTTQTVIKIDTNSERQTESGGHTESERHSESGRRTECGRCPESESQAKKEAEDYWAFNPTPAGNKLREQLKEEEDQKEREKEEKERKRKRTKGQNKALGAFLKVTDRKNQTKELERSVQLDSTCPFCYRYFPASSLQAHANHCPAVMKAP